MKKQNKAFYESMEVVVCNLYKNGKSMTDITKTLGLGNGTVKRMLVKNGVYDSTRDDRANYWKNQGKTPYSALTQSAIDDLKEVMRTTSMEGVHRKRQGISRRTIARLKKDLGDSFDDSNCNKETTHTWSSDGVKAKVVYMKEKGYTYDDIWNNLNVKRITAAKLVKKCRTNATYDAYLKQRLRADAKEALKK